MIVLERDFFDFSEMCSKPEILYLQQLYYSYSKKWHGINYITVGITIALVIERKKLSPEARKQTRASESLKGNAKISKERTHETASACGVGDVTSSFVCLPVNWGVGEAPRTS